LFLKIGQSRSHAHKLTGLRHFGKEKSPQSAGFYHPIAVCRWITRDHSGVSAET
jgi:hypothetical protein